MTSVLAHPPRADQGDAAYLARLGERVRAWRTAQGVTRKALALGSGVSERYLAQLEGGAGNMSVLLLRRVAQAMSVPIEELIRERDAMPRRARVALIGLRGAGKSTLGEKLAQSLGVPFVELDREVEQQAGAPLGEVFSMYGQDAFRRFERRALERVLKTQPRAVIARARLLSTVGYASHGVQQCGQFSSATFFLSATRVGEFHNAARSNPDSRRLPTFSSQIEHGNRFQ